MILNNNNKLPPNGSDLTNKWVFWIGVNDALFVFWQNTQLFKEICLLAFQPNNPLFRGEEKKNLGNMQHLKTKFVSLNLFTVFSFKQNTYGYPPIMLDVKF